MSTTILWLLAAAAAFAQTPPDNAAQIERIVDRVVERESSFVEGMKKHAPLVETYIQEINGPDRAVSKDHYFLGRLHFGEGIGYESYILRSEVAASDAPPVPPQPSSGRSTNNRKDPKPKSLPSIPPAPSTTQALTFLPRGFAQMAFIDTRDFSRNTYQFDYAGREFLGDVRCIVFDIAPRSRNQPGKFVGRLWVEDRDLSIVRFDGSYIESTSSGPTAERYFHFDSWRVQAPEGGWYPSQIYIEESGDRLSPGAHFKGQTRFWDYAAIPGARLAELTETIVEDPIRVKDESVSGDNSPLESQRSWERQAEENVLARLERAGLLAPLGSVDDVLNTVVQNLVSAAKLPVDVRCRVLLTTPLETFSIGRTIVVSRGLIDVLPDEASLAMELSVELANVTLAQRTPTSLAFHNSTMVPDADLFKTLRFERPQTEMNAASKKAIEILRASPYAKSPSAGLFIKALARRREAIVRLSSATMGNSPASVESLARLSDIAASAPMLEEEKLDQIAALPLGSRLKLTSWNNRIELVKTKPMALLSAREKLPFEVTPFAPRLTRIEPARTTVELAGP